MKRTELIQNFLGAKRIKLILKIRTLCRHVQVQLKAYGVDKSRRSTASVVKSRPGAAQVSEIWTIPGAAHSPIVKTCPGEALALASVV